jgi:hypothetical protein
MNFGRRGWVRKAGKAIWAVNFDRNSANDQPGGPIHNRRISIFTARFVPVSGALPIQ